MGAVGLNAVAVLNANEGVALVVVLPGRGTMAVVKGTSWAGVTTSRITMIVLLLLRTA